MFQTADISLTLARDMKQRRSERDSGAVYLIQTCHSRRVIWWSIHVSKAGGTTLPI
jgi:hypothetical protein